MPIRMRGHHHFDKLSANVVSGVLNALDPFTGEARAEWYVDSVNGSNSYSGKSPGQAVATIAQAISLSAAGDIIHIAKAHAETLTATITPKANQALYFHGEGNSRPVLTVGADIVGITVSAADVVLVAPKFAIGTVARTTNPSIAVTGARCWIVQPYFTLGANDLLTITVGAVAHDLKVIDPEVVVTANGPDSFIKHLGTVQRPVLTGGSIIGSDGTNAFDVAIIDYDSKAVVTPITYNNRFDGRDVALTVVANAGSVVGELMGPNTYAGSATSADNVSSQQEIIDRLGSPVNTGGTATLSAILGDPSNVSLAARLQTIDDLIDTEVAAIKAVTDLLPNAGALTSLAQDATVAKAAAASEARLAELDAANLPADVDTVKAAVGAIEGATNLHNKLTAARAVLLDGLTAIRLAELDAANLPANVDTLLTRLTALRAGYLDELDFDLSARLGVPAAASLAADLLAIDNLVDDLEVAVGAIEGATTLHNKLTVARAALLDQITALRMAELDAANLPADVDTLKAAIGAIEGATALHNKLTAARAALLDQITALRLAELDAANLPADIDTLLTRLSALRAGYLDELAAANIPADIDTLLARLTALRAGYLDELDFDLNARLGAPAGASLAADLLVIDNFVDDLESRLGTPAGGTVAANIGNPSADTLVSLTTKLGNPLIAVGPQLEAILKAGSIESFKETWESETIAAGSWVKTEPATGTAWGIAVVSGRTYVRAIPNANENARLRSVLRRRCDPARIGEANSLMKELVVEFGIREPDIANIDQAAVFYGLTDDVAATRVTDGIAGFGITGGNWYAVSDRAGGATESATDTGIAAGTAMLKVVIDGTNTRFYVDGVLKATHVAANSPIGPGYLNFYHKAGAGGGTEIRLDAIRVSELDAVYV